MRSREDLRPQQVALIEEMKSSVELGVILGMGGGKTVSALTAYNDLFWDDKVDGMLVFAPARVVANWARETVKWEHIRNIGIETPETPVTRSDALARLGAAGGKEGFVDIVVLSIDQIQWVVDNYDPGDRRIILCIDELSRLRNPRGKRAQALLKITPKFDAVWGLTGTPRPKDHSDLYMQLQVLTGGKAWSEGFDEWRRFRFYPDAGGYKWTAHSFAVEEIDKKVDAYYVRVPDGHVDGLPELRAGEDFDYWITPDARQEEAHRTMLKKLLVDLREDKGRELTDEDLVVAFSAGVASGKAEQIAQGFLYDEGKVVERYSPQKVELLRDLIEDAGENVLVAYNFKEDLALLHDTFGTLPYLGGGVSPRVGQKRIDDWNEGKIPIFAIHPKSAGHGIELQHGGRRLFWYNPTWSGEEYAQLLKRLHREGQTQTVYSHRIGMKGTVDELKIARSEGRALEETDFIKKVRSLL